ncbi:hypothetical protein LPJ74_001560 [Coemansia sp. RSA 1843]|nr:hypothetical protein LPJ74_001560 [Coemansia sp. RSA 1843]
MGRGRSSRSRSRGRNATQDGPPTKPNPLLIVYGITASVNKAHLQEIFQQYGVVSLITISKHWSKIRGRSKSSRAQFMAMIDFKELECAQKACEYMNGAMIDNEKIEVKVDELGRKSRAGGGGGGRRNRGGRKNRRSGRSGRNRRDRDRDFGRRRRGFGGGGRRYSRSRSPPPPMRGGPRGGRYSRSPSPYRRRRFSRDRRSPAMRPRSPDLYRRGGRSRNYSRSPSPRYGDYRGGRYGRSRSISRGRR